MDTFTTPNPPRLSIELKAGTVTVDTVDGRGDDRRDHPAGRHQTSRSTRWRRRPSSSTATTSSCTCRDASAVPRPRAQAGGRASPPPTTPACASRPARRTSSPRGRSARATVATGSGDITLGDFTDSLRVDTGQRRRARRVGRPRTSSSRRAPATSTIVDVGGDVSVTSGSGDIGRRRRDRALRGQDRQRQHRRRCRRRPTCVVTTASGDIRIDVVDRGRGPRQGGVRRHPRRRPRRGPRRGSTSTPSAGGCPARSTPPASRRASERKVRLQLSTVSGDIELARV